MLKLKKKTGISPPAETGKKELDLRSVMDRERPFSMFFSGVENDTFFKGCYDMGVRNFLMSYHYIRQRDITKKYQDKGISLFVDSGAYTYMGNSKYQEYTPEQWEKQIQSYLNWAKNHKDMIFAMASLDLDLLVGAEQVMEWNRKYFEPFMVETGIPVCFVYHQERAVISWEQHCQRYPYVGISFATGDFDLNTGIELLRIAEKHKSLVHGMAMTHTSLLTKLPFYTVDSTTWLVGLQYGEVNYWTGKKMTRLKKDQWKKNMLNAVCGTKFNREKLLEEDKEEMIKVNVHAFVEAEKFIQERLKSMMYWLKPDIKQRSEDDIQGFVFPDEKWLRNVNSNSDWKEWAEALNISTEDKNTCINCITDMTCFLNWKEPAYQGFISDVYEEELIKNLHDEFINRIVESQEDIITDLQDFYKECFLGKNDKLLLLGTNFDRIVKEREEYITDDEYDLEDVSPMELQNMVSNLLPLSESDVAPEISELDDEIFKEHNIIPVRDSSGKFLKGQKKVHRPKKMYSDKFPKLACDTCFNAQKCPEYKAGYACAYNKLFDKFDTRDMGDIIQAMQSIVNFSLGRLQRSMLTEMMSGGLPDPAVSGMIDQSMRQLMQLKQMYECGNTEVLKQTKIIKGDGTQETTTQVTNPQSGGILEKIFGGLGNSQPGDEKDIVNEDLGKGT